MQLFIISCFFCYFLFLFYLYRLGKEDFILIRKNIALEQLFNITVLTTLISVFAGRLIFVVLHWNPTYLNPLKFFVIPYFPGLILSASVAGGYLFFVFLYKVHKVPSGRLIDFYALAVMFIMPVLMLSEIFLFGLHALLIQAILAVVYFFIFIINHYLLVPRVSRGEIKDGTLGLVFLAVLCTVSFLQNSIFHHTKGIISFLQLEDFFYLFVLMIAVVLLGLREFWHPKKRRKVLKA